MGTGSSKPGGDGGDSSRRVASRPTIMGGRDLATAAEPAKKMDAEAQLQPTASSKNTADEGGGMAQPPAPAASGAEERQAQARARLRLQARDDEHKQVGDVGYAMGNTSTNARNDDDEGSEEEPQAQARGGGGCRHHERAKEISEPLAAFLGTTGRRRMARADVLQAVWAHVKAHDLQNPTDKREIILDDKMKAVFGVERFTMFAMNKYIAAHIEPYKPVDLTTTTTSSAPKKRKAKAPPKEEEEGAKRKYAGLRAPYRLSDDLAAVVGRRVLSRPQVTQALWAYIRENHLQNPDDKREILCDSLLSRVMGGEDRVTMFTMNKYIARHMLEKLDKDESAYTHEEPAKKEESKEESGGEVAGIPPGDSEVVPPSDDSSRRVASRQTADLATAADPAERIDAGAHLQPTVSSKSAADEEDDMAQPPAPAASGGEDLQARGGGGLGHERQRQVRSEPKQVGDVGYKFRKEFDAGWYEGEVVEIRPGAKGGKDRRCVYSDGDKEDLSLRELRAWQVRQHGKAGTTAGGLGHSSSSAEVLRPEATSPAKEGAAAAKPSINPVDEKMTDAGAAGDTSSHPMRDEDAHMYLDQVKMEFGDRPHIYHEFLDIMKAFRSQEIDTPGVIRRVASLFHGNKRLVLGFNAFLPEGHRMELPLDGTARPVYGEPGRAGGIAIAPGLGPPPPPGPAPGHPVARQSSSAAVAGIAPARGVAPAGDGRGSGDPDGRIAKDRAKERAEKSREVVDPAKSRGSHHGKAGTTAGGLGHSSSSAEVVQPEATSPAKEGAAAAKPSINPVDETTDAGAAGNTSSRPSYAQEKDIKHRITKHRITIWTCDVCQVGQFATFKEAVEHGKHCQGPDPDKKYLGTTWTCDVCKEEQFETFGEAAEHEKHCQGKRGKPQDQEETPKSATGASAAATTPTAPSLASKPSPLPPETFKALEAVVGQECLDAHRPVASMPANNRKGNNGTDGPEGEGEKHPEEKDSTTEVPHELRKSPPELIGKATLGSIHVEGKDDDPMRATAPPSVTVQLLTSPLLQSDTHA